MAQEKKTKQKTNMATLMADWAQDRNVREDEKKRQELTEKAKVSEYQRMLEIQEARNKQSIPPIRMPLGDYVPPSKTSRRKEERQYDEKCMESVRTANAKAAEEEMKKTQRKFDERHSNQDFLFKQMEERDNKKKLGNDELQKQKDTVQAEIANFADFEKQKAERQRVKNIQHRLELEKQIATQKPPNRFQKRRNDDLMSNAEVAMNGHLLREARSLRETVSEPVPELETALSVVGTEPADQSSRPF